MKTLTVNPINNLSGTIDIPGCKSLSHRAIMLASLAKGPSKIKNLLQGHDCMATVQVMRSLGAHISLSDDIWMVDGQGFFGLNEPDGVLDCKNSGTTIRLLAGILSTQNFFVLLDGTEQIKRRPMDRVIKPLASMGANIFGRINNSLAPLAILPSSLNGVTYELTPKSAQVKSAIILAGLKAKTPTVITNTRATRDHTENLLKAMGANIVTGEDEVMVYPLHSELSPLEITIPGDISSAAFLLVAGALLAKKPLILRNVGINPTRTGIIDALITMGANIELKNRRVMCYEEVADIHIEQSNLHGATFSGDQIVRMIDEIPILALLATQSTGTTIIKDAQELRVKESNRINKTAVELRKLNANIDETSDGLVIHGPVKLSCGNTESYQDHRLALMLSIAGLIAEGPVKIFHSDVIDDSFPGFINILKKLGANLVESVVEYE